MTGKLVGISVFLLFTFAVGLAAAGAVSQAYGGSTPMGLTNIAVAESDDLALHAEPGNQGNLYQAFTYVCPFH